MLTVEVSVLVKTSDGDILHARRSIRLPFIQVGMRILGMVYPYEDHIRDESVDVVERISLYPKTPDVVYVDLKPHDYSAAKGRPESIGYRTREALIADDYRDWEIL